MAIGLRGSAADGSASGDTTITLPGGTATGDVVYAWYCMSQPVNTNYNMTMTTAGYTELADLFADSTGDTNLGVYRKVQGVTPDSTAVFKDVDGARPTSCCLYVLTGVNATPEDATTTTATGGSGAPNSPSITTVTAGAWVLSLAGRIVTNTDPPPTNYINFVQDATRNLAGGATREITSPGAEDPASWASSGGSNVGWCAVSVAVRPAPASPRTQAHVFG